MTAGYGRGYYGSAQLAPRAPRRGGGWMKIALVVGVGAVVWLMWPRKPKIDGVPAPSPDPGADGPMPPPLPSEGTSVQAQLPQLPPLPQLPQLPQLPSSVPEPRGFASPQAYEDAIVENARQLQSTGAKVILAPHLAHLAPRLVP